MSRKIPPFSARMLIATVFALASAGATLGATPPAANPPAATPAATPPAPSKETREKMAQLHEQMAGCLRSDKSVAECRTEMMKSCQDALGKEGCPMMGMGPGMGMHHHMMQAPPISP